MIGKSISALFLVSLLVVSFAVIASPQPFVKHVSLEGLRTKLSFDPLVPIPSSSEYTLMDIQVSWEESEKITLLPNVPPTDPRALKPIGVETITPRQVVCMVFQPKDGGPLLYFIEAKHESGLDSWYSIETILGNGYFQVQNDSGTVTDDDTAQGVDYAFVINYPHHGLVSDADYAKLRTNFRSVKIDFKLVALRKMPSGNEPVQE